MIAQIAKLYLLGAFSALAISYGMVASSSISRTSAWSAAAFLIGMLCGNAFVIWRARQ